MRSMDELFTAIGRHPRPTLSVWGDRDSVAAYKKCMKVTEESFPKVRTVLVCSASVCDNPRAPSVIGTSEAHVVLHYDLTFSCLHLRVTAGHHRGHRGLRPQRALREVRGPGQGAAHLPQGRA